MFQYEAKVIRIVDGDTLWLDVDLGFNVHHHTDVRLARVNAPERSEWSLKGLQDPAKQYLEKNVAPGTVCVVSISKPDKYGRWLAEVLFRIGSNDRDDILRSPRNLSDELLREGLAEPYRK